jgi:hypothetical protein
MLNAARRRQGYGGSAEALAKAENKAAIMNQQ